MRRLLAAITMAILVPLSAARPPLAVEHIVVEESKPFAVLHGLITDPSGAAVAGARIELYDHPEVWLKSGPPGSQKLIAHTLTNKDGSFRFEGVPKGRYEIRLAVENFNPMSVLISYEPKNRKASRAPIQIKLVVAT